MDTSDPMLILARMARSNAQLTLAVKCLFVLWAITIAGFVWMFKGQTVHAQARASDVLTVRGLVVVDAQGKTRLRIGAPLPEPIIMGKQQKRDDSVSGILLYDALGNERGGYVTDNSVGNALLTLDSNIGQEVTLVAYPKGGALAILNDDEKNQVAIGALKEGPRLRLFRHRRALVDLPSPEVKGSEK